MGSPALLFVGIQCTTGPQAPCMCPLTAATNPKSKASSTQGKAKADSKKRFGRLSAKPDPAKVEAKPKKVAGKDKPADKILRGGGGGAKGKQTKVANQEIKDLSAVQEETKNETSPASDEGEKAKSG
ncbi:non-histone chromosomal protein HMG-14-like [Sturnira hondurensis]|uniref:non-histone chromosomal protein HMG-14-like n=1 Tax=Sturnira hondurensis TaxID=192404 RepID=UPI001879740D|nr:non-histone chromosomal protein HMG-14-like [Sturnira hondurensis]